MVSSKIIYIVGQINIVKVVHSESWVTIPDTAKNFPTYLSMSTMSNCPSTNFSWKLINLIPFRKSLFMIDVFSQRGDIWMKYDIFAKYSSRSRLVLQKISQAMQWFGEKSKTRWYFLVGWSNKKWQGRPRSHLEVIERGCRWYLGNI